VLEALLLTAVTAQALPHADARKGPPPSLELLEFLGEFGDDEDGLFEGEGSPDAAHAPAKNARAGKSQAGAKRPASPPASPVPPTTPDGAKAAP
jgi:hypothetical protein